MTSKKQQKPKRRGANKNQIAKTQQAIWDSVDEMISYINTKPRFWVKKLTQDILKKDRKKKQSNCSINAAYFKVLESKTRKPVSEKTLFLIKVIENYQRQLGKIMDQISKISKGQALQVQSTLHINLGMILENIQQLSSKPIEEDEKYIENFMADALNEAWKAVKETQQLQLGQKVINDYEVQIVKSIIPKNRRKKNKQVDEAKQQYILEQNDKVEQDKTISKKIHSQPLNKVIVEQYDLKNIQKPEEIQQSQSAQVKQQILDGNSNILLEQPSPQQPYNATPFKYKRAYDSNFIETTAKNMIQEANQILDLHKDNLQPIFVQCINIKVRLSDYYQQIEAICKQEPPQWQIKIESNSIQCCACKPTENGDVIYYLQPAFRKTMSPLSPLVERKYNIFFNTLIWIIKLLSFETKFYSIGYFEKGIKKSLNLEQTIFLLEPLMNEISDNPKIGELCFEVIKSTAQILQLLSPNIIQDTKQLSYVSEQLLAYIPAFRQFFEFGKVNSLFNNQKQQTQDAFYNIFFGNPNEYSKWTEEEQFGIQKTIYILITAIRRDLKQVDNVVEDVMENAFKGTLAYQSKQAQINSKLSHILQSHNGNIFKKMVNWIVSQFLGTHI